MGNLLNAVRFLRVMLRYRRAGASFLLRGLEIVPGFRRKVVYLQDRYQVKQQMKLRQQSIGHALGDRTIVCTWAGHQVCSLRLPEGVEATADQFFLNRPIRDAMHVIKLASQFVQIRPGELVFDPGCGAGRHLYYFVDSLGCRAIGIDIYKPAIEVAQTANWDRRVRFLSQSSIEPGILESVLPQGCDYVFINSWLNHIKDYPGYEEFARRVVMKCRYLLVITSTKDQLDRLLDLAEILAHEVRDGTQFALLRGSLSQTLSPT